MLIDKVEVELKAGKGGDGVVSWRREKFVPRGGPDGGDGGYGGDVYLIATHDADTLAAFRYKKVFQAEDGERGAAKKKTGAGGDDLELRVPVGTTVFNTETEQIIADMNKDGEKILVAKGGKGGLGNVHFVSATHQRPTEFTTGKPGQALKVTLELRFVADFALIGEPNSGKSSLLKALTGADVRIGDYAFSTTDPSLGVAKLGGKTRILVDLPGLLEGAHQGRGLGDKFLQHATRVRALIQVVDATTDVKASIKTISDEIKQYSKELGEKPRHIVINKTDLLSKVELAKLKKKFPEAIFVSVSENDNIDQVRSLISA